MEAGAGQGDGRQGRAAGRGALTNRVGRFEPYAAEAVDDGWPGDGDAPPPLRTTVALERPRRAITRNASPDIAFDRSINPYRGCEHGCVYCFARPTHAFLGLSPGLDFETRLVARPDMPEVLARELGRRGYRPAPIAIGTNTDPYQPLEARLGIMRRVLGVLRAHRHPVVVATKGVLVERDADLLGRMAVEGLAQVGVSVTTLDAGLSRRMEPRAPAPARRLAVIRRLSEAGVPVRVMVSPLVPGLSDHELEPILAAAREAGAMAASMIPLRLPREVAGLFREWLETHYPARAGKVAGRLRELHGGRDYDPAWGTRMTGQGVWAGLLQSRFRVARKRLGYADGLPPLRTDLFGPPTEGGAQLELF